jgi:ethanolamine utilization protein EutN
VNLARVVGRVWAGAAWPALTGATLLIVEELDVHYAPTGQVAVAADTVGAGAGELVFTVAGSSARMTEATRAQPVDLAIIGIIDPGTS